MVLSGQLTPRRPRRRPKVANPTNLYVTTFSGHDDNFKPMVEIFSV